MANCVCCQLPPETRVFWCPNHKTFKTPHWSELCRTRPAYRAAWEAGRGPGQIHGAGPLVEAASGDGGVVSDLPAWLACDQRGPVATTLMARDFGCGCGTIQLHTCRYFSEPIVLKVRNEARRAMIGKVEGYTGRTCATCPIPGGLPVQQSSVSPRQPDAAPAHVVPGSAAAASRSTR